MTDNRNPDDDPAVTGVPPETPEDVRPSATGLVTGPLDDRTNVDVADVDPRPSTEEAPALDISRLPAPTEGILMTHFIIVRDVARSRAFYADVLGGEVVLAENPCIVQLANGWVIMNPGGGPTPDKPQIEMVPYEPTNEVSTFLNLRVADIEACYQLWTSRGATFLTAPLDRGAELRCYMRDPDGYLIEVGQATGMLQGRFAERRPDDLPG